MRMSTVTLLTLCQLVCVVSAGEKLVLDGHQGSVTAVRFADSDRMVVTSCTDGVARLFDAASGKQVREYRQHTAPVLSIDVSQNGYLLASGGQDNFVRLWQLPSSAPISSVTTAVGRLQQLQVDYSGVTVYAAGDQGLVELTQRSSGADQSSALLQAAQPVLSGVSVSSISLSADGTMLVAADTKGQVTCWNPVLRSVVLQFSSHERPIHCVWNANSPAIICAVDVSGLVRVWNVADALAGKTVSNGDGEEQPAVPVLQKEIQLDAGTVLQAQAVGNVLLTIHQDQTFLLTDVSNGGRLARHELAEPTHAQAALRTDLQRIAVADGRRLKIFSNNAAQVLQETEIGAAAASIAFSADGRQLAVLSEDRRLSVLGPVSTGAVRREYDQYQVIEVRPGAAEARFDATGRNLLVAFADGKLEQWRLAAAEQLRQLGHGGAVTGVAFTPDGKGLVTVGVDQTVRVWDTRNGQQRFQMRGHQGTVLSVSVSADGTLALTSGSDGTLRLWDIVGGRQLKELRRFDEPAYTALLHPDNRHVVAAGADRQVHIIERDTGRDVRVLKGHADFIHALRLSSDGSTVVSYGYGGSLRLWEFSSGRPLASGIIGRIGNSVDISGDKSRIVVGNGDGRAVILETAELSKAAE